MEGFGYCSRQALTPFLPGPYLWNARLLSRNSVRVDSRVIVTTVIGKSLDSMLQQELSCLGGESVSFGNTSQLARADFVAQQLLDFLQN